jgi:hypothetical protein
MYQWYTQANGTLFAKRGQKPAIEHFGSSRKRQPRGILLHVSREVPLYSNLASTIVRHQGRAWDVHIHAIGEMERLGS